MRILCACLLAALSVAAAQDDQHKDHDMSGMHMPGHDMSKMDMHGMNPAEMFLMRLGSGTSENPASWPMPMIMTRVRHWNIMLMAVGFLSDIQQSGPRSGDKLYSVNWFMAAAQHKIGSRGAFETELMLSLDPATVTDRRYPLLFQTGETAYGSNLVDAQHPHNFIMALGFHYARQLAEGTTLDVYFAPVGDPALGPQAYPHRASAMELPEAPISHHWQDSTHIADEVVTAGLRYKKFKLEASGFYGTEPGENRWIIQTGAINSWSTRLWFFPTKNWAAQVSAGRIAHPEALERGDQSRITASVEYTKPMHGASWASSVIWGRTHNTATFHNLNSYLAESVLPVTRNNFLTGRAELVDKDELFADQPDLEAQLTRQYGSTFRIGGYTIGYTRDIRLFHRIETGIGANFTAYSLPSAIQPYYGGHPIGANLFARLRLCPLK